jgi:hypothetical protein
MRRINWVSILLAIVTIVGVYCAWAFGRVYWKAQKVDSIINDEANSSSDILMVAADTQQRMADKIMADTVNRLVGLGLSTKLPPAGNGLIVSFDQGYRTLHAKYVVTIKHPLIHKSTTLKFDRSAKVPTGAKF